METVSKKRGRPRLHDPARVNHIALIVAPDVKSNRQKQSRAIAQQAINCLIEDDAVLPGVERLFNLETNTVRVGVLEQLGRLQCETDYNDADVLHIARIINQRFIDDPELTTRQAVAILKQVRAACKREGQR